jgi:hypothetical protein
MELKPRNNKHIPLFEEHSATNARFALLPQHVKENLAAALSLYEHAAICGPIADYLLGESDVMPEEVDLVVRKRHPLADVLSTDEDEYDSLDYPPNFDDEADECECGRNLAIGEEPSEPETPGDETGEYAPGVGTGRVVIITLSPQGEIKDMSQPEDPSEGYTLEQLSVNEITGTVHVFETCDKIKVLPITLGNMTVLAETPGVTSEYRMKFAKLKGKQLKPKYDKSLGYDKVKKQPHVKKDNGTQDTPRK